MTDPHLKKRLGSMAMLCLRDGHTFKELVEVLIDCDERYTTEQLGEMLDRMEAHDEEHPVQVHETVERPDTADLPTKPMPILPEPPLSQAGFCFICGARGGTHKSWCKFSA